MWVTGLLCVVAALPSVGGSEWPDATVVQTSPRLDAIRPHLRAGVSYAELTKKIGREDLDLAGDAVLRPVYFLDGKYRGMWLQLTFDGNRLRSARVYDPKTRKVTEQVMGAPEQ